MKIRGMLAGLLVAASLAGCARSATAPEAPRTPVAAPRFDEATPPPPPPPDTTSTSTTTEAGGGALGSGH